ncbi:hypothetical protein B0H11DRAFT_1911406 [Mycena galericulata]|nr:hypothetical protein B0H11DRAFT_1911406 [Mycena galericulata]
MSLVQINSVNCTLTGRTAKLPSRIRPFNSIRRAVDGTGRSAVYGTYHTRKNVDVCDAETGTDAADFQFSDAETVRDGTKTAANRSMTGRQTSAWDQGLCLVKDAKDEFVVLASLRNQSIFHTNKRSTSLRGTAVKRQRYPTMPPDTLNAENKSLQTRKCTSFRRCEESLIHELATSNFHHSVNPESQCLNLPRLEKTTSPTHSTMQGSVSGDLLDPLEEHLRRELRKFTAPRLDFPPAPACRQRCANLYREYPERIKDAIQRAKEYAAESRGAIESPTGYAWRPGGHAGALLLDWVLGED